MRQTNVSSLVTGNFYGEDFGTANFVGVGEAKSKPRLTSVDDKNRTSDASRLIWGQRHPVQKGREHFCDELSVGGSEVRRCYPLLDDRV